MSNQIRTPPLLVWLISSLKQLCNTFKSVMGHVIGSFFSPVFSITVKMLHNIWFIITISFNLPRTHSANQLKSPTEKERLINLSMYHLDLNGNSKREEETQETQRNTNYQCVCQHFRSIRLEIIPSSNWMVSCLVHSLDLYLRVLACPANLDTCDTK